MTENFPDKWVVLEIRTGSITYRKVLASWFGGYLGSSEWKLSSIIVNFEETEFQYEFTTDTGSKYICSKNAYGVNSLAKGVLQNLQETAMKNNISIELVKFDKQLYEQA